MTKEKEKPYGRDHDLIYEYAEKMYNHMAKIFKDENDPNFVDLEKMGEQDREPEFYYALSTVMPKAFFNQFTEKNVDPLEFNHYMNRVVIMCSILEREKDHKTENSK